MAKEVGVVSWRKMKQTWHDMIQRCNNSGDKSYHSYGGRGIKVCEEWTVSIRLGGQEHRSTVGFENFYENMKDTWFLGATIDRIDVNKNYTPDNCRWITKSENSSKSNLERLVHGMLGKKHSEETKEKQSQKRKNYWTDEKRHEMSVKFRGKNNPMYKHGKYINE